MSDIIHEKDYKRAEASGIIQVVTTFSGQGASAMYEAISLFSGAMGLDLGLEKAGINVKLCQDCDPTCHQTMLGNAKPAMSGDIRAIASATVLKAAGLRKGS
ncbi:MAG: DNA cytosine methyltransferase, partial [Planctomycetes bacterium]|nr:DNA cytosine methyltransferase [Planctomycetota bacterium]